jgi:hypothetical protein
MMFTALNAWAAQCALLLSRKLHALKNSTSSVEIATKK